MKIIDILDAQIINILVRFSIVVDPKSNKNLVKQNIIKKLKDYFSIKNYEIDQPIYLSDIRNIIFNNPGVISINNLFLENVSGTVTQGSDENANTRTYSNTQYDIEANTDRDIVFAPPGGMFEVRYADYDIIGVTV